MLRKRAELAGEVEGLRAQLRTLLSALQNVDAAILIFRPDIELDDLPEGSVPAPFTGFRGEIQRFLLDVMRESADPLNTFELADRIMAKRGIDASDRIHATLIRRRTGYALSKLRKAGKVSSRATGKGAPLQWTLADAH
ncbi:MAG: hypothetical protein ABIO47_12060 [Sphingomicrobium sp.]